MADKKIIENHKDKDLINQKEINKLQKKFNF